MFCFVNVSMYLMRACLNGFALHQTMHNHKIARI